MDNIELVHATEEQERLGWVLDVQYLNELRNTHDALGHLDLEEIEAVLLVANGQGHLIKLEEIDHIV